MNELIKITPDGKISSRELYEWLQLNRAHYARWSRMNIVNNVYATKGMDWWVSPCVVNGNESMDYLLTITFAKKICMLSPTERGNQARNYFIEVEKSLVNQQRQLAACDPLDLIIAQATMMKEFRQMQEEQEQQLQRLNAKMETSPAEYFTIAGFASLRGDRVDLAKASRLGRKAALLSKEYGYDVGKTHDPRFGQVNTYHSEILSAVFESRY